MDLLKTRFERNKFLNELQCLKFIHDRKEVALKTCSRCHKTFNYCVLKLKRYYCSCGNSYTPLRGTIFYRSSISLKDWFTVLGLFACKKDGVTSLSLTRLIGVSYKSALRMTRCIRRLMTENIDESDLEGWFEVDETYIGGKEANKHKSKRISRTQGRSTKTKTPIIGRINRRTGHVIAVVSNRVTGKTVREFLQRTVGRNSTVFTDKAVFYKQLDALGYNHKVVDHSAGEYVTKAGVSTNAIESFWALFKRHIAGSHIWVSKKWLPTYLAEAIFRFNRRRNRDVFLELINRI